MTFSLKDYLENKSDTLSSHRVYPPLSDARATERTDAPCRSIFRHYGLLSNRCRKSALEVIRKILEKPKVVKEEAQKPQTCPCPLYAIKVNLVFIPETATCCIHIEVSKGVTI